MALRIPPGLLVLGFAGLMWLAARVAPGFFFIWNRGSVLAAIVAVAGLAVAVMGAVSFRRARTTVNPLDPGKASALVVSGIYRYTRNPMYLGFALVLLAWVLYLGSFAALLLVPPFVLYLNRFQIEPEERALEELFGPAYTAYRASVRRWI